VVQTPAYAGAYRKSPLRGPWTVVRPVPGLTSGTIRMPPLRGSGTSRRLTRAYARAYGNVAPPGLVGGSGLHGALER
jgi:hypothetical protein